jgi:hypothetical protein
MATALDLAANGFLWKLDAQLEPPQQELRMIHVGPKLLAWINNDLPGLESTWKIEQSPIEQMDDLTQVFCSGEPLTYDWQFKSLTHVADGVWELKTADLRIFGWFHKKDWFIGVIADTADRIKKHRLYEAYSRVEVVRFRNTLDLDAPKFVPGDNPHDVVSNYAYP